MAKFPHCGISTTKNPYQAAMVCRITLLAIILLQNSKSMYKVLQKFVVYIENLVFLVSREKYLLVIKNNGRISKQFTNSFKES